MEKSPLIINHQITSCGILLSSYLCLKSFVKVILLPIFPADIQIKKDLIQFYILFFVNKPYSCFFAVFVLVEEKRRSKKVTIPLKFGYNFTTDGCGVDLSGEHA